MRRIPISLDEKTYKALKRRSLEEGRSIAAIVRESVRRHLDPERSLRIEDFSFVGAGKPAPDRKERVSENHDAALAAAFQRRGKRK